MKITIGNQQVTNPIAKLLISVAALFVVVIVLIVIFAIILFRLLTFLTHLLIKIHSISCFVMIGSFIN